MKSVKKYLYLAPELKQDGGTQTVYHDVCSFFHLDT